MCHIWPLIRDKGTIAMVDPLLCPQSSRNEREAKPAAAQTSVRGLQIATTQETFCNLGRDVSSRSLDNEPDGCAVKHQHTAALSLLLRCPQEGPHKGSRGEAGEGKTTAGNKERH